MSQLVILALNGNNIASLSMSLGSLVNLEELYLHNNSLFEVPNTIVVLQKLQVLNLSGNQLETLPLVCLPPLNPIIELAITQSWTVFLSPSPPSTDACCRFAT